VAAFREAPEAWTPDGRTPVKRGGKRRIMTRTSTTPAPATQESIGERLKRPGLVEPGVMLGHTNIHEASAPSDPDTTCLILSTGGCACTEARGHAGPHVCRGEGHPRHGWPQL
jgi:hypothetical protein